MQPATSSAQPKQVTHELLIGASCFIDILQATSPTAILNVTFSLSSNIGRRLVVVFRLPVGRIYYWQGIATQGVNNV
jgi:hypothetical protein